MDKRASGYGVTCSSTMKTPRSILIKRLYVKVIEILLYIFPKSKFFVISRPEIRTVLYNVGKSSVDVIVSAKPNGNMSGIQPASTK